MTKTVLKNSARGWWGVGVVGVREWWGQGVVGAREGRGWSRSGGGMVGLRSVGVVESGVGVVGDRGWWGWGVRG